MRTITTTLLLFITFFAYAQKLPNVQQVSLRAPANIKVDGKANEWGDRYQAYNSATEIYYSLANTDSTLNLIIHVVKPQVIQKLLESGVEFIVTKNRADKQGTDVKLLFPSLSLADSWKILNGVGLPIGGFKEDNSRFRNGIDSVLASQKDNTLQSANKQLISNLKEIRYAGIDAIADTLTGITPKSPRYRNFSLRYANYKWISIYNEDDIMAMIQFDDKKELSYELSIPIKYITKNVTDGKLNYEITIHGRDGGRPGVVVYYAPPPNRGVEFPELFNPTNFKGEYTLSK